ncbi:MAG: hypothetical protein WC719_02345 [Patescibacteria group bacterium]|jgi:uncharacterized membrane protein YwzB
MKKAGIIFLFSFLILSAIPVQAALLNSAKQQEYIDNIKTTAAATEYDTETTLENRISAVVRIILSFIGTIFIVLAFLAGSDWMQAAGNEEKVKKSKTTIKNLMIGLVLILMAYALSSGFSALLVRTLVTK